MKKHPMALGLICVFLLGIEAAVQSITVRVNQPGSLYSILKESHFEPFTELTLTGTINAADIFTIRDSLTTLRLLDLKATTVAQCTLQTGGILYVPLSRRLAAYSLQHPVSAKSGTQMDQLPKIPVELTLTSDVDSTWPEVHPAGKIPNFGLAYCANLKSVILPATLTTIGTCAFFYSQLTSIELSPALTTIETLAFGRTMLTSVAIPASLNQLGRCVFSLLYSNAGFTVDSLNSTFASNEGVLYSKGLTRLIYYPLAKTDTSFSVPSPVTGIEDYAFSQDRYLRTLLIGNALDTIGTSALSGMSALKQLILTSTVLAYLDDAALSSCSALRLLRINTAVPPRLGQGVFTGIKQDSCVLEVPAGSEVLYRNAAQWNQFLTIRASRDTRLEECSERALSIACNADGWLRFYGLVKEASLTLFTLNGTTALNKRVQPGQSVGVSQLKPGVYLVCLVTDDGKLVTGKVVCGGLNYR